MRQLTVNGGVRCWWVVSLCLCGSLWASRPGVAQEVARLSTPAPDFTLLDEEGTAHTLSQYLGQIVVLEWTNPDCPFVVNCYANDVMEETAASLAADSVVWLAIDSTDVNTAQTAAAWKVEHGFAYPTLQDHDGTVGHLYGARTTPHMYVIDAEGVLRYTGAIHDSPMGDAPPSVNYVADAVTALLGGAQPSRSNTPPWGCTVKNQDR